MAGRRFQGRLPAYIVAVALSATGLTLGAPPLLAIGRSKKPAPPPPSVGPWRSPLYPDGWQPGFTDPAGRFLHDFSYAGYGRGEREPPADPPGPVIDVTAPPFAADPTGAADATDAIQRAIDAAGAAGGGVVLLPAGTYRVRPPAGRRAALWIHDDGVVLRGAGAGRTLLYNDTIDMRMKEVIRIGPDADTDLVWSWGGAPDVSEPLIRDAPDRADRVFVADHRRFAVGDWVVLKSDATAAWVAEQNMTGTWSPGAIPELVFFRRIEGINRQTGAILLDIPLRYPLKMRDAARVFGEPWRHLEQVGVEHLSIGMRQADRSRLDGDDHDRPGTTEHRIHNAHAIKINHVVDGWVRGVSSYRPADNRDEHHLLSMGIGIYFARSVTLAGCDLRHTQYHGSGGNGYIYSVQGSDNLIRDCRAEDGRHNFSFGLPGTSGNVILRGSSIGSYLPSDFHQLLSPGNLIDGLTLSGDYVSAARRECCGHGHGTTGSVLWNLNGVAAHRHGHRVAQTGQLGHGYVIGTRGPVPWVDVTDDASTGPRDLVEGVGHGADLLPQSLYEDQRRRRTGR